MSKSKLRTGIISRGVLFLIFLLSVLSACGSGGGGILSNVSTWTPSPSATPTCVPNSNLSTPIGWDPSSRLIIVLFSPNSNKGEFLEFESGEKTQNVTDFVVRIIPAISKSGDQVSVFQLGYREYENARFLRIYSYTEIQQLYNTPSPQQTLTPIAVRVTPLKGLKEIQATSLAIPIQTAHAAAATALSASDNCIKQGWNQSGMFTATSLAQTQIVEVATINASVAGVATSIVNANIEETPYANNVVYEGLHHASIDIQSECAKYDKCILIVIDDLNTWTYENLGDFEINLAGIDLVYGIMPDCKDINQPSCTDLQDFWTGEFEKYGVTQAPVYDNGIRAEEDLLDTIGR